MVVQDATVTMAYGRRYGLVGRNGTGKTTLLRAMAHHQIKGIPENCQILHVEQEVRCHCTLAAHSGVGSWGKAGGQCKAGQLLTSLSYTYTELMLLLSQELQLASMVILLLRSLC